MITITEENIFDSPVLHLVNPVNTSGVCNTSLMQGFKRKFTMNFAAYAERCASDAFRVTDVTMNFDRDKFVINVPIKGHFKSSPTLESIENCLVSLRKLLMSNNIKAVAIPFLGEGQIEWVDFYNSIDGYLGDLDVQIFLHKNTF